MIFFDDITRPALCFHVCLAEVFPYDPYRNQLYSTQKEYWNNGGRPTWHAFQTRMTMAQMPTARDRNANIIPVDVIICSGMVVNEVIPSIASPAILRNGYLDRPVSRGFLA